MKYIIPALLLGYALGNFNTVEATQDIPLVDIEEAIEVAYVQGRWDERHEGHEWDGKPANAGNWKLINTDDVTRLLED